MLPVNSELHNVNASQLNFEILFKIWDYFRPNSVLQVWVLQIITVL